MTDRTRDGGRRWTARSVLRARVGLRMLLRLTDNGAWVAPGVLGCAYPRTERALSALSSRGVRLLVKLHERPHDPARLQRHGLRQVHLPVGDFAAPSPEQMERGVDAIFEALEAGEAAAIHCGGGLGRTGTVLACYLPASDEDLGAEGALHRVRALRPGSVETPAQLAAVRGAPSAGPAETLPSKGKIPFDEEGHHVGGNGRAPHRVQKRTCGSNGPGRPLSSHSGDP